MEHLSAVLKDSTPSRSQGELPTDVTKQDTGTVPVGSSRCPPGGANGWGGMEAAGRSAGRSAGSTSSSRALGRPPARVRHPGDSTGGWSRAKGSLS